MKKKDDIPPIQKRLLQHFANGGVLSIKNMYLMRVSNCSREIRRNFEDIYNVELHRETIKWADEFSHGTYFEYSLKPEDSERIIEIAKQHRLYYRDRYPKPTY